MLKVGDKIYYNGILCPITQVLANGVMIRHGAIHRFIFATDLVYRDFEYCIVFEKDGSEGLSHTDDESKMKKEVELLESCGWKTRVYQREVKASAEGQS